MCPKLGGRRDDVVFIGEKTEEFFKKLEKNGERFQFIPQWALSYS
jgi:hypothetical protein